jgi:hypothetical protein
MAAIVVPYCWNGGHNRSKHNIVQYLAVFPAPLVVDDRSLQESLSGVKALNSFLQRNRQVGSSRVFLVRSIY